MKIISLFSGAGGLDLGLIQAGNTVIWANDIDKDAVATYKENIGDHIVCDDIKNIDISTSVSYTHLDVYKRQLSPQRRPTRKKRRFTTCITVIPSRWQRFRIIGFSP